MTNDPYFDPTTNLNLSSSEETTSDDVPTEIIAFLSENGIPEDKYKCTILRRPLDGGEPEHLPGAYVGKYPPLDEIGKLYGPGKYTYNFACKKRTDEGAVKTKNFKFNITLGQEYRETHASHRADLLVQRHKLIREKKSEVALENEILSEGDGVNKVNGVDQLIKTAGMLRELGVQVGGQVTAPPQNDRMLELLMATQARSQEMMVTMMNQQTQTMLGVLTAVMGNQNQNPKHQNKDTFQEAISTVMSMIEMKQAISPEKKSTMDKIFDVLGGVVPMILQIAASKGVEGVKASPIGQVATEALRTNPEYQEAIDDVISMDYFVQRMDTAHGKEATDTILATIGKTRPVVNEVNEEEE